MSSGTPRGGRPPSPRGGRPTAGAASHRGNGSRGSTPPLASGKVKSTTPPGQASQRPGTPGTGTGAGAGAGAGETTPVLSGSASKKSLAEEVRSTQGAKDQTRLNHSSGGYLQTAKKSAAIEAKKGKQAGGKQLKPAIYYSAIAKEYEDRATAHLELGKGHDTLLSRFGAKIDAAMPSTNRLDAKSDIIKTWDKNGDGTINKPEFRQQVKGLGVEEADFHAIDDMFATFDKDKDGRLDLAELKIAFKNAMVAASEVDAKIDEVNVRVAQLRLIAQQASDVAEKTLDLEKEREILKEMQDNRGKNVDQQLGLLMANRQMKVSDMTSTDSNNNGVDKKEFVKMVQKAGFKVKDSDVEELYDRLDIDNSDSLDLDELKHALHHLQTAAAEARNDLADEEEVVLKMNKIVTRLQTNFDKAQAEDRAKDMLAAAEAAAATTSAPAVEGK